MASIIYSPRDIFEQDFKNSMRGYDKKEVDEFLDNVIKDYESYIEQLENLQAENNRLKQQLKEKTPSTPLRSTVGSSVLEPHQPVTQSATNFDILKRISRLEKEVFGKQIVE